MIVASYITTSGTTIRIRDMPSVGGKNAAKRNIPNTAYRLLRFKKFTSMTPCFTKIVITIGNSNRIPSKAEVEII